MSQQSSWPPQNNYLAGWARARRIRRRRRRRRRHPSVSACTIITGSYFLAFVQGPTIGRRLLFWHPEIRGAGGDSRNNAERHNHYRLDTLSAIDFWLETLRVSHILGNCHDYVRMIIIAFQPVAGSIGLFGEQAARRTRWPGGGQQIVWELPSRRRRRRRRN